jgi:hypothetical protein
MVMEGKRGWGRELKAWVRMEEIDEKGIEGLTNVATLGELICLC